MDVLNCFIHGTRCHQHPSVLTWNDIIVRSWVVDVCTAQGLGSDSQPLGCVTWGSWPTPSDFPVLCALGLLRPVLQPGGENHRRRGQRALIPGGTHRKHPINCGNYYFLSLSLYS